MKFFNETETTNDLTSCFISKDFNKSSKSFFKELNRKFHKCFTKVRVKSGGDRRVGNPLIQAIFNVQSAAIKLRQQTVCHISLKLLSNFQKKIEECLLLNQSKEHATKVKNHISSCESDDGRFDKTGFWKLKRRLCPPCSNPPMVKVDNKGNLVTSPDALKSLYLKTYVERLSHRKMKPELDDIFELKNKLWNSRLQYIEKIDTQDWQSKDLLKILAGLANNKSLDPNGMCNEVLKPGCIGIDLQQALLCLFNLCKSEQKLPDYMALSNVTSIFKNKGSRTNLENDRGIFLQTILKKVLDKLIYVEVSEDIDKRMSDSNIGARKHKNIRDHLFILYSIINSVVNGNNECIDIQIYDIQKCFDSLWIEDCFNDLYDVLPASRRNNKISLLYKANETNLVAVKTPAGLTDRVNLPYIIQQGGVWGSLLCSNTIDTIGKKCQEKGKHIYLYKNLAEVLPLGFVDDLNGVAKCGDDSRNLNTFLNTQIEAKKLTFHTAGDNKSSKCVRMHVGKKLHPCPPLKVHENNMDDVTEITYLGDKISADGKNSINVQDRTRKGVGLVCQILKIINSMNLGSFTIEIVLLLRNSILINGMLTNAEVWFDLKKSELEAFEKVDLMLFHKVLRVPHTVPAVGIYLEMGVIPISLVVKQRRLNYLHTILRNKKTSMLYKVFKVQWLYPCKGDWTTQIKIDLNDLNLPGDLETLEGYSKAKFKNLVKSRIYLHAVDILNRKKDAYSKLKNLNYADIKTQKYLTDAQLSHEEKQTVFKFRTRMTNCGDNFRAGRENVLCPLCKEHIDSQFYLLKCPELTTELNNKFGTTYPYEVNEVFNENINKTLINMLKYALEVRDAKLSMNQQRTTE